MTEITDEMCKLAIDAQQSDRFQGFSSQAAKGADTAWGPPHYIRDLVRPQGEQVIWRGDSRDEMMKRIRIEEMRLALRAALGETAIAMTAPLGGRK